MSGSLRVHAAFLHRGAIRGAIHALKYDGIDAVAGGLAPALADLLPSATPALVPVPRSLARRWRHGVDQAALLADAVGRRLGVPVVRALRAGPFDRSRLVRRDARAGPYRLVQAAPSGAVLVDDVVTTGATLHAASVASGLTIAITVTCSPRLTRVSREAV